MTENPGIDVIEGPDDRFTILHLVFDSELKQSNRFHRELKDRLQTEYTTISIGVRDWNRDLSPWKAPPVFGKDDFGDGAKDVLDFIERDVIPQTTGRVVIGGYSMAGLFSLWCGYESKAFQGIAATSPSVWFPGWMEYISDHTMDACTVYLSIGNRESHTKNAIVSKVAENIEEQYRLLCSAGIDCMLEWNEGNHFDNVEERTIDSYVKTINEMHGTAHHP